MQMVGMISYVGASICWSFFFGQQTCVYKLYKINAATFGFNLSPYSYFVSAVTLWRCCVFWSVFLLNAMLWLNIFMALDLINSIKFPFRPKTSRYYVLFTIASSFIVACFQTMMYTRGFRWQTRLLAVWFSLTSLIYLCSAVYSILYARRKLQRPGISREVRDLVFRRHIVQIVVFIFSYSYFFVSIIIDWFITSSKRVDVHNFFLSALKINFALQGLYLPLSRVIEPAFVNVVKKKLARVAFYFIF